MEKNLAQVVYESDSKMIRTHRNVRAIIDIDSSGVIPSRQRTQLLIRMIVTFGLVTAMH